MSSLVDERLKEAMRALHTKPFHTIGATVLSVDRDQLTVDVQPLDDSQAEIFDVRLRAAIDGDKTGLVLIPVVGSTVLVSAVGDNWNSAYVAMVSEVDLITIQTARESLKKWMKDLLAEVRRTTHTSPAGETKFPTNAPAFQLLENRLDDLFLN